MAFELKVRGINDRRAAGTDFGENKKQKATKTATVFRE